MSSHYKLRKLRFAMPLQAEEAEICRATTSCMKLSFARPLQTEEAEIFQATAS